MIFEDFLLIKLKLNWVEHQLDNKIYQSRILNLEIFAKR